MIFQKDWFMRQIETMVQTVARLVFQKELIQYEIIDEASQSQTDLLYTQLMYLLADRKICEAENLLFTQLDVEDEKYLELALDFYHKINLFNDEDLQKSDFSREEINQGLLEIMQIYQIQM